MTSLLLIEQHGRMAWRGFLGEGRGPVRPARDLRPFPLADAIKALSGGMPHARVITMGVEQWDGLLSAAYAAGFILVELDENERPLRAYRRTA